MTDSITDAVRRIKGLQDDVERLKAGRDDEGEPRVFITERDRGIASDTIDLRPSDIVAEEVALATDEQAIRKQREHEPATWGSAGWATSGYND